MTVNKQQTEVRSDHLLALARYAYTQLTGSYIPVLDYAANEQGLDIREQIEYVACLLTELEQLTAEGHQDLTISKK